MSIYFSEQFSKIDWDNLEEWYKTEIIIDKIEIEVDVFFDEKSFDTEKLKR